MSTPEPGTSADGGASKEESRGAYQRLERRAEIPNPDGSTASWVEPLSFGDLILHVATTPTFSGIDQHFQRSSRRFGFLYQANKVMLGLCRGDPSLHSLVPALPCYVHQLPPTTLVGKGIHINMLFQGMVQHLGTILSSDNKEEARDIFFTICSHLHNLNIIDNSYRMPEFDAIRCHYRKNLALALENDPSQGIDSRYHTEFDDEALIGCGGFGSVWQARHKLDGQVYAVKKIKIASPTLDTFLETLREVKIHASLNSKYTVPYKGAWLEVHPRTGNGSLSVTDASGTDIEHESSATNATETNSDSLIGHESNDAQSDPESDNFIQFKDETEDAVRSTPESGGDTQCQSSEIVESSQDNIGRTISCSLEIETSQQCERLSCLEGVFILYIYMEFCKPTLRTFLDSRNDSTNIGQFYDDFLRRKINWERSLSSNKLVHNVPEENTLFLDSLRVQHRDIVLDISLQLLKGLKYLHSTAVVHHDIKPDNIFIKVCDSKINVRYADFGLSCFSRCRMNDGCGTRPYAAPEQLDGKCDPKSDIYSLGIILLELLVPFNTTTERYTEIENTLCGNCPNDVDPDFKTLLLGMLQEQPSSRMGIDNSLEEVYRIRPSRTSISNECMKLKIELKQKDAELQNKDLQLQAKDEELRKMQEKIRSYKETEEKGAHSANTTHKVSG